MTGLPVRPPSRQGDLDGLCGVYSIINAIALLELSLPSGWRQALFEDLLVHLATIRRKPLAFIVHGMDFRTLRALAKHAERQISSYGQSVEFCRLSKWRGMDEEPLWYTLRAEVSDARPAIISCGREASHWTVVRRVTSCCLILQDSIDLQRIRKVHLSIKGADAPHIIKPKHVLFVRRNDQRQA